MLWWVVGVCWFECIMSLLDYHNYILAEEIRKIILNIQFQLSVFGDEMLLNCWYSSLGSRLLTKSSPWDSVVIAAVLLVNEYNFWSHLCTTSTSYPTHYVMFVELSLA